MTTIWLGADPLSSHLRCSKSATNPAPRFSSHPSPFLVPQHASKRSVFIVLYTPAHPALAVSIGRPASPCMSSRKRQAEPLDTTRNPKHRRLSLSGRIDNSRSSTEVGTLGGRWLEFGREFWVLVAATFWSVLPCTSRLFLLYGALHLPHRSTISEYEKRGGRL